MFKKNIMKKRTTNSNPEPTFLSKNWHFMWNCFPSYMSLKTRYCWEVFGFREEIRKWISATLRSSRRAQIIKVVRVRDTEKVRNMRLQICSFQWAPLRESGWLFHAKPLANSRAFGPSFPSPVAHGPQGGGAKPLARKRNGLQSDKTSQTSLI